MFSIQHLASESLIQQIPRILGPGLKKSGQFPSLLTHNKNVVAKVDEVESTVTFQMKKLLCGSGCQPHEDDRCRACVHPLSCQLPGVVVQEELTECQGLVH